MGKGAISHHARIDWMGKGAILHHQQIAVFVDSFDNKVDANGKLTSYSPSLGPFLTLYQAT